MTCGQVIRFGLWLSFVTFSCAALVNPSQAQTLLIGSGIALLILFIFREPRHAKS